MSHKNKNIEIGKKGEAMAAEYLRKLNYQILERNYRKGRVEIDIIARLDKKLVFVEVKTRTGYAYGLPEEAVDEAKQESIEACAEEYILDAKWEGHIRFDIIAVNLNESDPITHFTDVF